MNDKVKSALSAARKVAVTMTVPRVFWPSALAALFLSSVLFWGLSPMRRSAVLYFPLGRNTGKLAVEHRYVVPEKGRAGEIRRVLEELFLGPVNDAAVPLASAGTRVTVVEGEKVFYVDIGRDFLAYRHEPSVIVTSRRALELVEATLRANFPGTRFITTVDGREPEWGVPDSPPPSEAKKN